MNTTKHTGIVLINSGTPDEPTPKAVRRYLREFLSDRRVIQLPRILWLPILYGIVLPLRAKRSAHLYQNIWQKDGAPMRLIMQKMADQLGKELNCPVKIGMNYGNPSISHAIDALLACGVDHFIMLPLYPQYSHTSTGSSIDRITAALREANIHPRQSVIIKQYADQPAYISALAESVNEFWKTGLKKHLLISFHGIPKRYVVAGDPYADQCEETALALAKALNLTTDEWTLCYQSKFGYDKWLEPNLQNLLPTLPRQGILEVDVICPGFAVDCLETLEEIELSGKEIFESAGGKALRYIPALNASSLHIDALKTILSSSLPGS